MSARLARLALALYPLAYRRRYGEEMTALVEDASATPATVFDLVRGAARAHLRPEPGLEADLGGDDRLRLGLSSILLCWVVFSAAGLGLYKTTEDHVFTAAGDAHGLLSAAHFAIQALAAICAGAVVLGVVPLVVIALRQARDRRAVERATVLAVGCLAVFGLAGTGNGPLELLSVAASLGIQLAVMVAVTVPAGWSVYRARRAAIG